VTTALERTAARVAALLDGPIDTATPVPGLAWTVRETAAHLVTESRAFAGYAAGERDPMADLPPGVTMADPPDQRGAAVNARMVASYDVADGPTLARDFAAAAAQFVQAVSARPPDTEIKTVEGPQALAEAAGVIVAEYLVHGLDMARALQRPWPISRDDAVVALLGVSGLAPAYVDPARAGDLTADFEIRLRGGPSMTFAFSHGHASVADGAPDRADCRISADPVAYLLTSFGRASQWRPILTGRIVSFGRKPWLGLKLAQVFRAP